MLKLTQNDTLKFSVNGFIEIQMRVKTNDGNVMASDIKKVSVQQILKDGEI